MASEALTATLTLAWTDVTGQARSASYAMPLTGQTRLNAPREFTIGANSTVDLWDPSTWAGYPETAFTLAAFAIQDIGTTPSVTPLQLEVLPTYNTTAKSGLVLTIPAGGWIVIPSNASLNNPTNSTDQYTGSAAALINRFRVKNASANVNVKLSMYLVDSTAP